MGKIKWLIVGVVFVLGGVCGWFLKPETSTTSESACNFLDGDFLKVAKSPEFGLVLNEALPVLSKTKFSKIAKGLSLIQGIAESQPVESRRKKLWLKPRLSLGGQVEIPSGSLAPILSVYPLSYGEDPDISSFRFLGVGVSGNKTVGPQLSFRPVSFNLKPVLKILRNTYVGPALNIGLTDRKFSGGFVLEVGL